MADFQRRAQQLSIIAVVAALHIAACWLLLATTRPLTIPTASQRLQLVFILPPVIRPESNTKPSASTLRAQHPSQQSTATPPASQPSTAPSSDERNAIHPPIDWAAELDRAAKESVPAEPSWAPRNFGFPHAATAPPSKSPEFAWSHARTHRVESIPGGGLLINVNDRCVVVLFPLPFFGCGLGKKPPNGELFEHMHDATGPMP